MNGIPWSEAELATLRRLYGRRTRRGAVRWAEIERALPGRSRVAIVCRATELRRAARRGGTREASLVRKSPWTGAESSILLREWSEVGRRTLLEKLPGRTWTAIRDRALELGLDTIPQGWVSMERAADRAGYSRPALARIVEWANSREMARRAAGGAPQDEDALGVPLKQHTTTRTTRSEASFRWTLVEWDACARAVERWVRLETCREAARRLGIERRRLAAWLAEAGFAPPPCGRSQRRMFRVEPEVYDRVARAHGVEVPVAAGLAREAA